MDLVMLDKPLDQMTGDEIDQLIDQHQRFAAVMEKLGQLVDKENKTPDDVAKLAELKTAVSKVRPDMERLTVELERAGM
jgi:hypothetical protein